MRSFRSISPYFSSTHKTLNFFTRFFSSQANLAQDTPSPPPSPEVAAIVDEMSGLTLLEISDLTHVLRNKMGMKEMPFMTVIMPGMGFSGVKLMDKAAGGGGAAAAKGAEEKVEKAVFDLKLDGFDAAAKIKVIKEVRACTALGLKEAKDLVEKVPTLLKKGVPKEEAEKIVEMMKAVGANVSME